MDEMSLIMSTGELLGVCPGVVEVLYGDRQHQEVVTPFPPCSDPIQVLHVHFIIDEVGNPQLLVPGLTCRYMFRASSLSLPADNEGYT